MHWVGQNWAFREKGIHPAGVEQRVGTPEVFIQSKCVKGFGGSRAVLLGRTTDLPLRSGQSFYRSPGLEGKTEGLGSHCVF